MAKNGRPAMEIEPEMATRICEELALGDKSLRQIAREEGISHSLILKWAAKDESFRDQYRVAREIGDDAEFERLIDEATEPPLMTERGVDSGWVSWKKNQIDTMKWILARKRPKKYGERIEQEHTGSLGVQLLHSIPRPEREK